MSAHLVHEEIRLTERYLCIIENQEWRAGRQNSAIRCLKWDYNLQTFEIEQIMYFENPHVFPSGNRKLEYMSTEFFCEGKPHRLGGPAEYIESLRDVKGLPLEDRIWSTDFYIHGTHYKENEYNFFLETIK